MDLEPTPRELSALQRRIRELEAAIRIRRPTLGDSRKARAAQDRDQAELKALKKS